IVLNPAATGSVVPAAAVTTTTRVPVAAVDDTVRDAVSCVPSAFTMMLEAAIAVSIAPLEFMNRSAGAPARFLPLIVNVTVAPRAMLPGEMLEIAGPIVSDKNWLKLLGAVPGMKPNRTDTA